LLLLVAAFCAEAAGGGAEVAADVEAGVTGVATDVAAAGIAAVVDVRATDATGGTPASSATQQVVTNTYHVLPFQVREQLVGNKAVRRSKETANALLLTI
jgi:hypothetical protein